MFAKQRLQRLRLHGNWLVNIADSYTGVRDVSERAEVCMADRRQMSHVLTTAITVRRCSLMQVQKVFLFFFHL